MKFQMEQWMSFHAALLLISTLSFFFFDLLSYLLFPVGFSFLFLFWWKYQKDGNGRFLWHAANLVTSFRLIALLLITYYFAQLDSVWIGLIALGVLLLDGLDGYLARQQNTSSLFGEYLDMETDAFYVLVLSCILYQLDYFSAWILGIGLLRYAYFLVLKKVKNPEQKEARVFRARLIAVILMATMAACLLLPQVIYEPAMVIAAVLVVFSFGESFWSAISSGDFGID